MARKTCPHCEKGKAYMIVWEAHDSCDDCPQKDRNPMCIPEGDDEYEPCYEQELDTCEWCNGTMINPEWEYQQKQKG